MLRQLLRRKFFALLDEGRQLPEEECEDLVEHITLFKAYRDPNRNRDQDGEQQGEGSDPEEGDFGAMKAQRVASLRWNKRNTKPKAKSTTIEDPSETRRATSMLSMDQPFDFSGLPNVDLPGMPLSDVAVPDIGLPNVGHLRSGQYLSQTQDTNMEQ